MGKVTEIELVDGLDGWTTARKMAERESITVQSVYYRISSGRYKAISLDKIILVKFKDPKRLRRREAQVENKGNSPPF